MPILVLALMIMMPAVIALMVPFSIVQRYRAGTARRQAKGWIAATNLFFMFVSVGLFLMTAAFSGIWIPYAFSYSLAGIATGGLLGGIGIAASRWEATPRTLHYTPNRWLVLSITLVVSGKLLFSFWRMWQTWHVSPDTRSWLVASGLNLSMAVGAVVLGYYLVYWAGVWMRVKRHRRG